MKKKKILINLLIMTTLCLTACTVSKGESELENTSSISTNETNPASLKNLMTETERSRIKVGSLTLLDDDPAVRNKNEGKVQIYIGTAEDWREKVERLKDYYDSPEEYEEQLKLADSIGDNYIETALVDGRVVDYCMPALNYDGGELSIPFSQTSGDETGRSTTKEWTEEYKNFDEYKTRMEEFIPENYAYEIENGIYDEEQVAQIYRDTVTLWQSVIDGTYEEIPKEEANKAKEKYEKWSGVDPFNGSFKRKWEFNRSEVEEIKDSVNEISVYDEELDTEFLVHVTLPPNFDSSKTYPMFMFTDGVWRFGNCPSIRKLMENGEVQDVILVTLGYNYNFDGTSMQIRSKYFYEEREKTLDFITNNLAPYLSETYNIDFAHSGIYGHSAGGVFTHYAVFNSDKYENQPFQYYIIGSPALWQLHRLDNEKYPDANVNDYNYWDRHDTLDKTIFLCGGENEDPDYEEYYDGYDTTLEGIANLMNRLESHGVTTAKSKIYENSGHWQFIPDMFIEFFQEYYAQK